MAADIGQADGRILFLEPAADGKGGEEVTARSASADDNAS
jgi:hypothetical protein